LQILEDFAYAFNAMNLADVWPEVTERILTLRGTSEEDPFEDRKRDGKC
jgi:hypothetical protein